MYILNSLYSLKFMEIGFLSIVFLSVFANNNSTLNTDFTQKDLMLREAWLERKKNFISRYEDEVEVIASELSKMESEKVALQGVALNLISKKINLAQSRQKLNSLRFADDEKWKREKTIFLVKKNNLNKLLMELKHLYERNLKRKDNN